MEGQQTHQSVASSSSQQESLTASTESQREVVVCLQRKFRRSVLKKKMVHAIIARRYGSLTDFTRVIAKVSDVAKALHLHWSTVKTVIKRFHRNGDRYVP